MKKAILVEIGGSHSECLYSQIKFFSESDYVVELICSKNLADRIKLLNIINKTTYYELGKSASDDWKSLRDIKRDILERGECKVIFNSAGGNLVRNLVSFHYSQQIEFIGVLHDLSKLTNSFSQKLINRKIKKYFVLNDYLKEGFAGNTKISIESFYPVFFPEFNEIQLDKKGEFWVCIPGAVEFNRRDYKSLISCLESGKINENIKFILLGSSTHHNSDASIIKDEINSINLDKQFVFFDGFVNEDIFHSYLKASDLIMPLIHQSHPYFLEIDGLKISGTFNLAFAHKKPVFCEDSFSKFEDFRENGIFYRLDNMIKLLNELSQDINILENKSSEMYRNPKWSFGYQKKRYLDFIDKN